MIKTDIILGNGSVAIGCGVSSVTGKSFLSFESLKNPVDVGSPVNDDDVDYDCGSVTIVIKNIESLEVLERQIAIMRKEMEMK